MHPRLLNVLHDRSHHRRLTIRDHIHIDLRRIFQKPVHQHRPVRTRLHRITHVMPDLLVTVHDLHRPPTQHKTRPHQHRIRNPLRNRHRLILRHRRPARRLIQLQIIQQLRKKLPVLRQLDVLRRRPDDVASSLLQLRRQIQRGLPPQLHDHPPARLVLINVHHILERQRLEVQPVTRVIIRRHRLRIRIHHDRLKPHLLQRKRRMHTAVVKLNPLTNPVRPAPQNHHLPPRRRPRLVLLTVRRIIIRRVRLELGRTRVHQPVRRHNPMPPPQLPYRHLRRLQHTQLLIRKP